jgi:hypothetical protein
MGGVIIWKYCAWLALFSSPAAPLAVAWRRLLKEDRRWKFRALLPTTIASVSLLWFDAAVMNYRLLGPLYGWLHYAVTGGNLLAVLVCGLVSLALSSASGVRAHCNATAVACLLLTVEWIFLGIANR